MTPSESQKEINDLIPLKDLIEKIKNWRLQMVDDVNSNYAGKSYTDSMIAAAQIKSLVDDVQVLMKWVEILARHQSKLLFPRNCRRDKNRHHSKY